MKRLGRVIAFLLILAVLAGGTYSVLSWKDTMGERGSSIHQLRHTDDDLMDVVFVGTSHVFCGIFPGVLWNDYGIASFDMSVSGMDKDSEYYHLKHLLKTQSPKLVFVDMFPLTYDEHAVKGNEYRNMLSLPFGKESFDLVNSYAQDEDKKGYWLKWPYVHTRYKELEKSDFYDYDFGKYGRGEGYNFHIGEGINLTATIDEKEVAALSEKNLKWLDSLFELSNTYDFQLVLFTAPAALGSSRQTIMNATGQYASENGLIFLDGTQIAENIGLDPSMDYSDGEHLNAFGALKYSHYLAEYINSLSIVEDRREDVRYEYWNLDAMNMAHRLEANALQGMYQSGDYEALIAKLPSLGGINYVISLEEGWNNSTLPLSDYLEVLGVTSVPGENGGVWVGHEGIIDYSLPQETEEIQYYDIDKNTTVRMRMGDNSDIDKVFINNEKATVSFCGMNIAVYDNMEGKVLFVMGLY